MVDDIYTLTIKGTLQGQRVENVLWYVVLIDGDYSAFIDGMFAFATTTLIPACGNAQSTDFVWNEVRIQKVYPLPTFFPSINSISIAGVEITNAMPSEVSMTITKRTFLAGRRYRGRMYLAGMPYQYMNTTTGLWTTLALAAAAGIEPALSQDVPAAVGLGVLRPIIWHRATSTYTILNGAQIRVTPRSQRRRQIGRGE